MSCTLAVEPDPHNCIDESGAAAATTAYGRSKYYAELSVLALSETLDCCCLRPALVYGEGVKGNLRRMVKAIITGRFPPLPEFGNRRSMISRSDVISAIMITLGNDVTSGKVYCITDGQSYSTRQLYEMICRASGKKTGSFVVPSTILYLLASVGSSINMVLGKNMFDLRSLSKLSGTACYDDSRFRTDTGWCSSVTFQQEVEDIVKKIKLA